MPATFDTTSLIRPALVLIDWQDGFDDEEFWGGNRNNPQANQNAAKLLDHWRSNDLPIAHVVHHSLNPKSPLRREKQTGQIQKALTPRKGEPVFHKRENGAFVGTDMDGYFRRLNTNRLVMSGLTTNHCVGTSVRMANNRGYNVHLVGDACATFDRTGPDGTHYPAQLIHDMALSDVHGEFCQVIGITDIIA